MLVKALGKGSAHQEIPCICDQCCNGHGQVRTIGQDHLQSGIFTSRSEVEHTEEETFYRSDAGIAHGYAKGERYRKISKRDGNAITHTF